MFQIYKFISASIASGKKAVKSVFKHGLDEIPVRYLLVTLSALVNGISYTVRTSLNLTIVAIVKQENVTKYDTCPELNQTNSHTQQEYTNGDYEWSESVQGIVLGAYYYGYIVTQVNGGQLADWLGSRWLIGLSVLISGILTILIPLSAQFSVYYVIALRVITGLVQGVLTPAIYTMLAYWIPRQERSTALAIVQVGGNIGAVLTSPISAFLCEQRLAGGWHCVFYTLGSFACLCFIPWMYCAYNTPAQHPRIKQKELIHIQKNVTTSKEKNRKSWVPWLSIVSCGQVWTIAVTKFCVAWGNLFIMTKLPKYLQSILHLSINKNGLVNAMVYVVFSASLMVFGFVSDVIERKQLLHRTVSRKLFEAIALIGAAIFLSLVATVNCDQNSVIILLLLSMIILGLTAGGDNPIVVDIAPDYSGSVYGLTNAIASTPGFLAPLFVGLALETSDRNLMKRWNILFVFASVIYIFGAFVFVVFISSKPEQWGKKASTNLESNKNTAHKHAFSINVDKELDSKISTISDTIS